MVTGATWWQEQNELVADVVSDTGPTTVSYVVGEDGIPVEQHDRVPFRVRCPAKDCEGMSDTEILVYLGALVVQ